MTIGDDRDAFIYATSTKLQHNLMNFWLLLSLTQQEYAGFPFSAKVSRVSSCLQCEIISRLKKRCFLIYNWHCRSAMWRLHYDTTRGERFRIPRLNPYSIFARYSVTLNWVTVCDRFDLTAVQKTVKILDLIWTGVCYVYCLKISLFSPSYCAWIVALLINMLNILIQGHPTMALVRGVRTEKFWIF